MEEEMNEVVLHNDLDENHHNVSLKYILIGAVVVACLLLVALAYYFTKPQEDSTPTLEAVTETQILEEQVPTTDSQTGYYEYPFIKHKWDDGAVIKENDWGVSARDMYIKFISYDWGTSEKPQHQFSTPVRKTPELIDVVPQATHIQGSPVHFAEVYDGEYYGRIAQFRSDKDDEYTVKTIQFVHDLEQINELFKDLEITSLDDVITSPKFSRWENRSTLNYDVTFSTTGTQNESHTLPYRSTLKTHVLAPSDHSVKTVPEVALTNLEKFAYTGFQRGDVNIEHSTINLVNTDSAVDGFIKFELDISNTLASSSALRELQKQYFEKLDQPNGKNSKMAIEIFAANKYAGGDGELCRQGVSATFSTNNTVEFLLDLRNPGTCTTWLIEESHQTHERLKVLFVDIYDQSISSSPSIKDKRDSLVAEVKTEPFLIASDLTLFNDEEYHKQIEKLLGDYSFTRYLKTAPPAEHPCGYRAGETMYKYNHVTKKYEALPNVTNDLLECAPVFLSEYNGKVYFYGFWRGRVYTVDTRLPNQKLIETDYIYLNPNSSSEETRAMLQQLKDRKYLLLTKSDDLDSSKMTSLYLFDLVNQTESKILDTGGHTLQGQGLGPFMGVETLSENSITVTVEGADDEGKYFSKPITAPISFSR